MKSIQDQNINIILKTFHILVVFNTIYLILSTLKREPDVFVSQKGV